jgi:hemerythrin superfamily protein
MADVIELIEQDHRRVERIFGDLVATSDTAERRSLLQELELLLLPHTEAEEQAVYPFMETKDLESFDRHEADEEHAEAAGLLEVLKAQAEADDEEGFQETLPKLIAAVKHHVQEEEQDMLPELRQTTDSEMLAKLADRFATAKQAFQEGMTGTAGRDPSGSTIDLTKEELYEKAKQLDIEGRSKMTKAQLARAVGSRG